MASDFRTTQEQKLWDQLTKELDDVDKLASPKSVTRVVGTLGLMASRIAMTPENERQMKAILGKLRNTLGRSDLEAAKTAQAQRELTSEVRTFVAQARVKADDERRTAAQFAVKAYRERLQKPERALRNELIARRAAVSPDERQSKEFLQGQAKIQKALDEVRDVIGDVTAGIKAESAGITNIVNLEARIAKSIDALNVQLSSTLGITVDTANIPRSAPSGSLIDRIEALADQTKGIRASQVDIADHIEQNNALVRKIKEAAEQAKADERAKREARKASGDNAITSIVAPNGGMTGLAVPHAIFQPDIAPSRVPQVGINNLDQYEQEKVDNDRRTFLSLFNRLVDNVANMTRGDKSNSDGILSTAGGFLKNLFAMLGLGKLLGIGGKGGSKKGLLTAIGAGVAAVAGKLGGRFASLFGAASAFATKKLGPGIMTALRFVLKRGVFMIPFIGPLIGALMLASDGETMQAITDWLGPTFSKIADLVGGGFTKIGEYLQTQGFTGIVDAIGAYAPPVIDAVKGMLSSVNDALYKPFMAIRGWLTTYADKWKDIPVLGSMMRALDQLFNNPEQAGKDLWQQMQGSASQNMESLTRLLGELSDGKGISELSATKEVVANFHAVKDRVNATNQAYIDDAKQTWSSAKDTASTVVGGAQSLWQRVKNRASETTQAYIDDARNLASSVYGKLSDAAGSLYSMSGRVNVNELDPGFSNQLLGAFTEYQQAGGRHRITLTSGFRSLEDQERLYAQSPGKAAPPGRSLHQHGLALDADRNALGEMDRMGILNKYGLERPFSSEPWHVQPIGLTDPAAKAGIFSADSATTQGRSIMFQSGSARPMSAPVPEVGASNMKNSPPPVKDEAEKQSKRKTNSSSQTSSVDRVPKYSVNDQAMFATNLGVLAP